MLIKADCLGILFVYGEFLNVISFNTVLKQLLSKPQSAGTLECGAAQSWHILSGVCYLVRLMQGISYNVPILTYHIGF